MSWRTVLGISVSGALIWWVLHGEDPGEIIAHVSSANPWLLAAALFVGTLGFLVRAMRWQILLHPLKPDTRLHSRFASVSIGAAVNNVLPARLGEFARALALRAVEPIPVSGALGSLVVERFLDSVVLLSFFLVPMALPSFPEASELLSGTVGGAILRATFGMLAIFFVALVALLFFPGPLVRTVEKLCAGLPGEVGPRMVSGLESFLEALKVLRHPGLLTKAIVGSVVLWSWHGLSFWLAMRSFGIDLGFDAALFTMALAGFATAIPAAPGFFGTFQLGTDLALSGVYDVPEATALAFSFGYHLGGFFPITIIGLYYASRLGFSLKDFGRGEAALEKMSG